MGLLAIRYWRSRQRWTAARLRMTHDLIERMIQKLNFRLDQIVISELRDSTFYAKLVLRRNGEVFEVDSRPSDAIAVGAGTDTPIFVDDSVLREVC